MSLPTIADRSASLHALLRGQFMATPQAIAVEFAGIQLTYGELDRRSNQLARLLQIRGVNRGVLVGVSASRSLEMIVSLLAVLKAGGAYVPLEIQHGATRILQIADEARLTIAVADESLFEILASARPQIACVRQANKASTELADAPLVSDVTSSDLAYVIFTSGSTGKPKGVEIEHRSLINFLESMRNEPGLQASDTLLAVTNLAFDIAGLEMYLPLLVGGRVVIAPSDTVGDAGRLRALLDSSHATAMQATPATWRLLFEGGWQGNRSMKVMVGGEALSPELAKRLASTCGEVWNMYGPTETTIWSALYRVHGRDQRIVPIGRHIAETTLHILGPNLESVHPGKEGELYIGGEGLARGYLFRPDITAERFIPNPFSSDSGARLYKTGDIVRRRVDGEIEFLGRTDNQVKIQGFRIELGEVEAVLEQCSGVRQAIVSPHEATSGEKYLVAYVVLDPSQHVTTATLRTFIRDRLPGYMVPSSFVALIAFPLTANGKVDRKALPIPNLLDVLSGQEYVAPRNQVEETLVNLWQEVLGMRPIGVTVSFFDLGGRSLQAAQVFMRIGKTFGKDLPLSTLFRARTIECLANELQSESAPSAYSTLIPIQPNGTRPAFFCVHGGEGSTLFLKSLANRLHQQQPFYGIEPEGLDGKKIKRNTIEQMASHYLSEVRKIQPHGPYFIGGYCFGGIVAVEMAQQLRIAGEQASVTALFSAPLRFNRLQPTAANVSRSANPRLKQAILSLLNAKVTGPLMLCRLLLRFGGTVPPAWRTRYIDETLRRCEWQYRPHFYPGTLHLFRGIGIYDKDINMGWEGLAQHLQHHPIGETRTQLRREIMQEPLVEALATELGSVLADAQVAPSQETNTLVTSP